MLEHHADAQAARMRRVLDDDRLLLPADLAAVRLHHAIDDLDQRALAGAVFPKQRVDLVVPDDQVDLVVGQATGKLLDDPGEPQQRMR